MKNIYIIQIYLILEKSIFPENVYILWDKDEYIYILNIQSCKIVYIIERIDFIYTKISI